MTHKETLALGHKIYFSLLRSDYNGRFPEFLVAQLLSFLFLQDESKHEIALRFIALKFGDPDHGFKPAMHRKIHTQIADIFCRHRDNIYYAEKIQQHFNTFTKPEILKFKRK